MRVDRADVPGTSVADRQTRIEHGSIAAPKGSPASPAIRRPQLFAGVERRLMRAECVFQTSQRAKRGRTIAFAPLRLESQRGKHAQSVFTYQGAPIVQLNTKAFRKALAGAGIEGFRWHDLRHTWASWHVQNGTPLHVLQELGGWASSDMVRVYAHLSIEHLREHVARNHDRVRDRHPKGRHRVSGSGATRARSRRETPSSAVGNTALLSRFLDFLVTALPNRLQILIWLLLFPFCTAPTLR